MAKKKKISSTNAFCSFLLFRSSYSFLSNASDAYRAWAPPADCSHLLFLPHYWDTKHFVKTVHFITAIKKNSYFWETASCGKIKASILEVIKKDVILLQISRGFSEVKEFSDDLNRIFHALWRGNSNREKHIREESTL